MTYRLLGSLLDPLLFPGEEEPRPANNTTAPPTFLPAYRNGFSWSPRPGVTLEVQGPWFKTREESHKNLRAMLVAKGYTPPKWWEFWRWGSMKLPFDWDDQ